MENKNKSSYEDMVTSLLEEMARNLRVSHVSETVIRGAIMNTCGNLCGNSYDAIIDRLLGEWDRHAANEKLVAEFMNKGRRNA